MIMLRERRLLCQNCSWRCPSSYPPPLSFNFWQTNKIKPFFVCDSNLILRVRMCWRVWNVRFIFMRFLSPSPGKTTILHKSALIWEEGRTRAASGEHEGRRFIKDSPRSFHSNKNKRRRIAIEGNNKNSTGGNWKWAVECSWGFLESEVHKASVLTHSEMTQVNNSSIMDYWLNLNFCVYELWDRRRTEELSIHSHVKSERTFLEGASKTHFLNSLPQSHF